MRRPNILILYTDQQRWDAMGCAGNDEVKTPHLDRLAAGGVRFDRAFVQSPVCMPSRVSFLSGRYPSSLGITHMGVPVPEDLPTLPRYLSPYGYHTANIGKLHFLPHANRDHRVPHPSYGFDHLEISDEPGVYEDAYRAWARHKTGGDAEQMDALSVGLPPRTATWYEAMGVRDTVKHPDEASGGGGAGRSDFLGARPFEGREDLTHTAFVGEQTIEYLHRKRGQTPFLCIAGFYSPHAPWVVPQRFLDLYDPATLRLPRFTPEEEAKRAELGLTDERLRSARQGYYAMISEVDEWVGRILDTLDELGIADDTAVVFTSDHGEWLGESLRFGKGYPADDAVSRVPLIVRPPADVECERGGVARGIVEAVDVLPTLLELAGVQVVPGLQGRSLMPMLRSADQTLRSKTRSASAWGEEAGEEGGSALTEGAGWRALRTRAHRYVVHGDGRERLWEVDPDEGEREVTQQAGHAATLAELRHTLLVRLLAMERPLERTWTY